MNTQIAEKLAKVNDIFRAEYEAGTDDDYEDVLDITLGGFSVGEDTIRVSFEATSDKTFETVVGQIDVEKFLFEKDAEYLSEEIVFLVEENFFAHFDPHSC